MTYVPITKAAQSSLAGDIPSQGVNAGAIVSLPFATGLRETSYAVMLSQNCAITISAGVAGADQLMTIDLIQGGSGGYTPNFANVAWPGGIAPSFNMALGKQDMVQVRAVGADIMGWPVSMGRLPLIPSLPVAPIGVATVAGVNQNTLSAMPVAAFPQVTGYNVYAGPTAGGESAVPIASNVTLPYVDSGLTAGVNRFYRVAAVNSIGVGAVSVEVSGVPVNPGAVPPIHSGTSVSAGNGQVTVSAAAVSASPAVTGYSISRGVSAGGESTMPIASNVALPYVDNGLVNGTTYFYTVAAINLVGTGPASSEISATPINAAPAAVHYAAFTMTDAVIYAPPNAAFNPASNPFDMQAFVQMANWSTSSYGGTGETCLWGCWDINVANRLWRLGLTSAGAIRASWATSAASDATAVSSVPLSNAGGTNLWIRAVVMPTTGVVTFTTSTDGSTWTQLGTTQTASASGTVYTPATLPYLVIGSNASGGANGNTAEQFTGRFYEARLFINGVLVTNPVIGATGLSDSKGIVYTNTANVSII